MSEKKEAKKAKKAEKKAAKAKGHKSDKAFKTIVTILLVVAIVSLSYLGIQMNKSIKELNAAIATLASSNEESNAVTLTFTPGTYGGVDFQTLDDVVNYYNEAYNKTKAKTAQYKDADGNTQTFYAMLTTESLNVVEGSLLIDGSPASSMIQSMIPQVLGGIYSPGLNGMSPSGNRNPDADVDGNGESLLTSRVTIEDVEGGTVEETADGMIKIVLMPKRVEMATKGMDAQGHFFNALGAIDTTIEDIGITWASGTTADNCKVVYENGTATVVIDPATGEMTEGDYEMLVSIDVTHVNAFGVLKDRGAALTLTYQTHFPADAEYMASTKGVVAL